MSPEFSMIVLIPSFNSGEMLSKTVAHAMEFHQPVLVVSDGSTDGSVPGLCREFRGREGLAVIELPRNEGKGEAVLHGLRYAIEHGHTHALVLDADGQHPCGSIPRFRETAAANPDCMILGVPVFSEDAPAERVHGRKVGNWFAGLATIWSGIGDSLFGFRVYPVAPALNIMESIRTARRFDFDTELAVRLVWQGVRPLNLPAPVAYPARQAGGVTHFRYLRDNWLLMRTHIRLFQGMLVRLPALLAQKRRWRYAGSVPCRK